MTANRINGFFNTLNVTNDVGRIRLDIDGNIRLVGKNYFLNITDLVDINIGGDLNLISETGDISLQASEGSISLAANAPGASAISFVTTNSDGGVSIQSGTAGTLVTSTGDISFKSDGGNINIGYPDNEPLLLNPDNHTVNIQLEATDTISGAANSIYLVANDMISFLAPEIQIGTDPANPFFRVVDDCLLIDSAEPNGIRKVLIDSTLSSLSKPGYDGMLIRTINDGVLSDVSCDLTLQTMSKSISGKNVDSEIALGVESLTSINAIQSEYIAYKNGNVIVPIETSKEFTSNDIGTNLYWKNENVADTIIGITGYITPSSVSTSSPTPVVSILTTGGHYTGSSRKYYKVEIDNVNFTPNTFKWSNDGGKTFQGELLPTLLSPSTFTLEDGITITFSQITGFSLNTYWTFTAMPAAVSGQSANYDSQILNSLTPGIGYLSNNYRQDFMVKTSGQERLRITDNGQISIGNSEPTATFEVTNKVGTKILLSVAYSGQQINPAIAGLTNGGWVAVWESYVNSTDKFDIFGQIFYPDGTRNGNQFKVNTSTTNNQSFPFVTASLTSGKARFLVVWSAEESLNLGQYDIKGRVFDADLIDGSRAINVNEFLINSVTSSNQKYPVACGLKNGNYVVTWSSNQADGGTNIDCYCQRLGPNGTSLIGEETKVNTVTSLSQSYPYVSYLDTSDQGAPGGFVISYISEYQSNFFNVNFQVFNANGVKYGTEKIVSLGFPKTYGRTSVCGLYNNDFVITYNEGFFGDNTKFTFTDTNKDTITGSTSSCVGILTECNPLTPQIIKVQILTPSKRFLIGEEFTTNLSNRTEKIENVTYISNTIAEILLSRDTKLIKAARYTSNGTLVYLIDSVNTTPFENDSQLSHQSPTQWTRNYTLDNSNYTLPIVTETYDKNIIIVWTNGSIPNIYYQKFDVLNGSKIGDERHLQKNDATKIKYKNPLIAKIVNKSNNDCGLAIVYYAETYDTSDNGVVAELINDDNSIMKIVNGHGNLDFTNQGFLGIGTSEPESLIHIKGETPVLTLQNSSNSIGNGLGANKVIFKNSSDIKLAEILGCYSTSYESRNPLSNNLIRWFKLDDTNGSNYANDSSRNNTSGFLNNFDIYNDWTDGKIKGALRFSGEQYIDCGIHDEFVSSSLNGLTVSTWLKVFDGGVTGAYNTILSTGMTSAGNYNLSIGTSAHAFGTIYTHDGVKTIRGSSDLADGQWHNLVFIYDNISSDLKLYLDGSLESGTTGNSSNVISSSMSGSTNLLIGNANGITGADRNFYGYLDDIRIYDASMSYSNVTQLYENITLNKGKLVFRTNNGVGISDNISGSVNDFTIDAGGFIESVKTRALPNSTLSGVITPTGTILSGLGTKFLSEVSIGDEIIINDVSRIVIKINSDIELIVNSEYIGIPSDAYENIIKRPALFSALDTDSTIRTLITAKGNMSIGQADTSAKFVITGTENVGDYPNLYLNNITPGGSINQLGFRATKPNGTNYEIGKIETVGGSTDHYFKFSLEKDDLEKQSLVLYNNGYLGLNDQNGFVPQAHIHVKDRSAGVVNLLLESGESTSTIRGGQSIINFKSKNISTTLAKIIGSVDNISNNSRGRLDFITNNGTEDVSRFVIKSDDSISFYLPEPYNKFNISPKLSESGSNNASQIGTVVTGNGFSSTFVGCIIYYKTSRISKYITSVSNSTTMNAIPSASSVIPSQPYSIYKPGFNITSDMKYGFNIAEPSSDVQMIGELSLGTKTIAYANCDTFDGIGGNYLIAGKSVHTLLVDTSGGVITIKLPQASTCSGRIYNIKRIAGAHDLIIDGYLGEKIDNIAQWVLTTVYKTITIQSDGINKWDVLTTTTPDELYRTIGTVTQLTSGSTPVTLNSTNGIITTFALDLTPGTYASFIVNNTLVSSGDQIFATINGFVGTEPPGLLFPIVSIYNIVNNSFNILLRNHDPVNNSTGTFKISFQVIKAQT
jgi:hypothetical protein